VVELLREGYEFVVCHINAPDEASHGGDLALKIETLQHIDRYVLAPVVEYFMDHRQELGGVMIVPDHYTNVSAYHSRTRRAEIHSSDPVPFALWNDCEQDEVVRFSEDDARNGKYAYPVFNHLDLLRILGVQTNFQQQHLTTDNTDQIRILSV
jgi:2,3-bisphosphoglycerate-independent phosphoglycerate mutase